MVANPTVTVVRNGGVILRTEEAPLSDDRGRGEITVQSDGKATESTREYLTFNLSVLRPKSFGNKLEVLRGGTATQSLFVATEAAIAAPRLVRVTSTAPRTNAGIPAQMYPPTQEMTVELGQDKPATAYTLVIYKLAPDGTRSVAEGLPDQKRVIKYVTGGKRCSGGGFETLVPGERIAVAWLDVYGRLSPRSQVVTVGAAKH